MFDIIKCDGSHWKCDYIEIYEDFLSCITYEYFEGHNVGDAYCVEFDLDDIVCIVNMHNSKFEEVFDNQSFEISDIMQNSNIARGVLWKIEN